MSTLMMVGPLMIDVENFSMTEVDRDKKAYFAEHNVINSAPKYEYTGPGEETLTLKCHLFPHRAPNGMLPTQLLDMLIETGTPQFVLRGGVVGQPVGWYIIDRYVRKDKNLMKNATGRVIDTTITLKKCEPPSFFGGLVSIFRLFG